MTLSVWLYFSPSLLRHNQTAETRTTAQADSGHTPTVINQPTPITLIDPATARIRLHLPQGGADFYITPATLVEVISYTSTPNQPPSPQKIRIDPKLVWQTLKLGDKIKLSADKNNNILLLIIEQ